MSVSAPAVAPFIIGFDGGAPQSRGAAGLRLSMPVLVLLVSVLAIALGLVGGLGNALLSARFLGAAVIINLALLAWRLAAIGGAALAARPSLRSDDW